MQKPRDRAGVGEGPPGGAAAGRQLRMSFLPREVLFGLLARTSSRPAAGVTVFLWAGRGAARGAVCPPRSEPHLPVRGRGSQPGSRFLLRQVW